MTAPVWLRAVLAGLMMAVVIGCAVRLGLARRRGRRLDHAADGVHAGMGVAMAGMLLPRLSVLPAVMWEAGFGAAAVWFGWRVIAGRRASLTPASPVRAPLAHFIECVAMMFMLLPATAWAPGSAFAGPSAVLALLLALCMVGYVVWTADTLVRGSATAATSARPGMRLAAGGSIAMSVAMWYMLIQMV